MTDGLQPPAPGATVGMIGVGHMGLPMASRLLEAGYVLRCFGADPLALRRASKLGGCRHPCTGGERRGRGAAVAAELGRGRGRAARPRVRRGGATGTVLVDMGSSRPSSSQMLGGRYESQHAGYVDAPGYGGVAGAEAGLPTSMVGGPEWAVTTVRPVLDVLGSKVLHVGDLGAGHALKALNNLLSATHMLATSEAMRIGAAFGLEPETMLTALNSSSGRSGSTQVNWPRCVLTGSYDSGYGLRLMLKDMQITVGVAGATGRPAAPRKAAARPWDLAAKGMPADADHTEIVRWLDSPVSETRVSDGHPV